MDKIIFPNKKYFLVTEGSIYTNEAERYGLLVWRSKAVIWRNSKPILIGGEKPKESMVTQKEFLELMYALVAK